jgi:hypothetical protein
MSNYLVSKEAEDGIYVVLDGQLKFMSVEHEKYPDVVELVDEYNDTRDKEDRSAILTELKETFSTPLFTRLSQDARFLVDSMGQLYYKGIGEPIPGELAQMMQEGLNNGVNTEPYINFWKNLAANPDKAVRSQLFGFLEHNGHPITKNGYFLAYKAVDVKRRYDKETGMPVYDRIEYSEETGEPLEEPITQNFVFTSMHKGPFGGTIQVGKPVRMPRKDCDPNPNVTCSQGLHVGSMEYVGTFGGPNSVVLEVLVNPRNVVAVPTDYNNTKMRVCEYYPFAISNGKNESVYLESDYKELDDDQKLIDLAHFEQEKLEAIEKLEKELEEQKRLLGGIL